MASETTRRYYHKNMYMSLHSRLQIITLHRLHDLKKLFCFDAGFQGNYPKF